MESSSAMKTRMGVGVMVGSQSTRLDHTFESGPTGVCHTVPMRATLRAFLEGLIDYAGLFPPARLDMGPAVAQYLRYVVGPEAWLVRRFACPVSRLSEFGAELPADGARGIGVTAIGRGGDSLDSFLQGLALDLRDLESFASEFGERAAVECLEARTPPNACDFEAALQALSSAFEGDAFAEAGWEEGISDRLALIAEHPNVGAKARTGGLPDRGYPSARDLAEFLQQSIDLEIPFKLTAGLHHPFCHDDPEGRRSHGFLNVLAAAALHWEHQLSVSEIAAVLEDSEPGHFRFEDTAFGWTDLSGSIETVRDLRGALLTIGSCSVDEPLEDLASLGLAATQTP